MSFQKGDVVIRARAGRSVANGVATAIGSAVKGRICRVVTPGLSYKVTYEGLSYCILQFESSLQQADEPGPDCPAHSSC